MIQPQNETNDDLLYFTSPHKVARTLIDLVISRYILLENTVKY